MVLESVAVTFWFWLLLPLFLLSLVAVLVGAFRGFLTVVVSWFCCLSAIVAVVGKSVLEAAEVVLWKLCLVRLRLAWNSSVYELS